MGVRRLSTWEVQRQISFMKERSMVSKRDDSWLALLVTKLCFCSVAVVCYYCTKMTGLLHLTLFCFDVVFFFTSWIRAVALRKMFITFHPVKHFCLCLPGYRLWNPESHLNQWYGIFLDLQSWIQNPELSKIMLHWKRYRPLS